MINVTKTFFPPIEEYQSQLKKIWENQWLTNRGKLTLELEEELKKYLGVDNILLMNNGTIPLQIALHTLGFAGEIITTPFSYIATSAAILWQNCKPVFVDIENDSFNIDPTKIEKAITKNTTCILATHVFGNPCNIEALQIIADRHNLKIIYDAAHCFGVQYRGKSIFEYGDISTCSFHATKLFHTGEGGAIFSNDLDLNHKLFYSHNFGHDGPIDFFGLGINGKISELQSAMGLSVLPYVDEIIQSRKLIVEFYDQNIDFNRFSKIKINQNTNWNYSYYPVVFQNEEELLKSQSLFNENLIYPRRYFHPSLNKISFINGAEMKISESISSRIMCLPLSHDLDFNILEKITNILSK